MKKIITVSLALIFILGSLTSCGMVKDKLEAVFKPNKVEAVEDNAVDLEPLETKPVETEPVETDSLENNLSVNLKDHLGNWHPESQIGEKELRITEISLSHVMFSLWYDNGTELENVSASLSGNTAVFTMLDTANTISGELIFGDTYVKLRIDDTNVSYFDVGLTVFDGKHYTRYEDSQYDYDVEDGPTDNYDSPSLEPSVYVRSFTMYVATGGDTLHLRVGPGQDYTSLCLMPDNYPVTVWGYSDDGEWSYVYYREKDLYGWCFNEYLDFNG
ncbi:MAG: SH3 domain-containing protein [Clostridia bacterium]|nr:SH3 domain-containing protein [Clostridia bacterium]